MHERKRTKTVIARMSNKEASQAGFEAFKAGFDLAQYLHDNAVKRDRAIRSNQPTPIKKHEDKPD